MQNTISNIVINTLKDLYTTTSQDYIRTNKFVYNQTQSTPISKQSLEAINTYYTSVNGNIELAARLVKETRDLILEMLNLSPDKWDIVFTGQSSEALNIASYLVHSYIHDNEVLRLEYEYSSGLKLSNLKPGYLIGVNPLSDDDLINPLVSIARSFGADLGDVIDHTSTINTAGGGTLLGDRTVKKITGMPFIDSSIGYMPYSYYVESFPNHSMKGMEDTVNHIILDARHGGLHLFNPSKILDKTPLKPNLEPCAAIVFSGHTIHSTHLGILVIRKKYLERDLSHIPVINASIKKFSHLGDSLATSKLIIENKESIEGSSIPIPSILGFGAFLDFVKNIKPKNKSGKFWSESQDINLLETPKKYLFKLKTYIKDSIPELSIVDISKMYKVKDFVYNGISILISSEVIDINDLYAKLLDNNIIVGKGTEHMKYGTERFELPNSLKISFDWSTNEKDLSKLQVFLGDYINEYRDSIENDNPLNALDSLYQ